VIQNAEDERGTNTLLNTGSERNPKGKKTRYKRRRESKGTRKLKVGRAHCGGQSREGIYTRGVKVTAPTVSAALLLTRSRDTSRIIPVSSRVYYSRRFKSRLLQSPFANATVPHHRVVAAPAIVLHPRVHARARAQVIFPHRSPIFSDRDRSRLAVCKREVKVGTDRMDLKYICSFMRSSCYEQLSRTDTHECVFVCACVCEYRKVNTR